MFTYVYFGTLIVVVVSEMTAPGIDRTVSDKVHSLEYKLVYGDEDINIVNEVITDMDKQYQQKSRYSNWQVNLKPLDPEDVKCLMSIDQYCSKEMGEMKRVLIEAVTNDCNKCTKEQREKAGKVVAAMMAHDSVAWKMFLTRLALQTKKSKEPQNETTEIRFKLIGEPEVILSSKYRYTHPGFQVKVEKYVAEKLS